MISLDVQFWDILKRDRPKPYQVRWVVAGRVKSRSFLTKALADRFRSGLVQAARAGRAFDAESGLPVETRSVQSGLSWFDHAQAYAEMKWPRSAATSRKSRAEALVTITLALVSEIPGRPDGKSLRSALLGWAFNALARKTPPSKKISDVIVWVRAASRPIRDLAEPDVIRNVLDACTLKVDGSPASATTARRKRAVLTNALGYAVELGYLDSNPVGRVQWTAPSVATRVDRRVVANPEQAARLIAAVGQQGRRGPHMVGFFGCLYYAATRPAEARAIREGDCFLPAEGWGRLDLVVSEPRSGAEWSDSGLSREARGLKHRGERETRSVPIPPVLVELLRSHIERFGAGPDGRVFRTERGGILQETAYLKAWRAARVAVLSPAQVASPLARRPYDLRHAAVSTWLNAGVPATEVARRAGHGVGVMLAVYANCIDGQGDEANNKIAQALGVEARSQAAADRVRGTLEPARDALRSVESSPASQERAKARAEGGGE